MKDEQTQAQEQTAQQPTEEQQDTQVNEASDTQEEQAKEPTPDEIVEFCLQQVIRGAQIENYVREIRVHPELATPIRQLIGDHPMIPEVAKSMIIVSENDGTELLSGIGTQRAIEAQFLHWFLDNVPEMKMLQQFCADRGYPIMLTFEDKKRLFLDFAMREVLEHSGRTAQKGIISASAADIPRFPNMK